MQGSRMEDEGYIEPMAEYNDPNLKSYYNGPRMGADIRPNQPVKIFVGSLPPNMSEKAIRDIFSCAGMPISVKLLQGFGFVEYKSECEAEMAIRKLDGALPHKFKVQFAKQKLTPKAQEDRQNSGNDKSWNDYNEYPDEPRKPIVKEPFTHENTGKLAIYQQFHGVKSPGSRHSDPDDQFMYNIDPYEQVLHRETDLCYRDMRTSQGRGYAFNKEKINRSVGRPVMSEGTPFLNVVTKCAVCGIPTTKACPCATTFYCSDLCQAEGWYDHKVICRMNPNLRPQRYDADDVDWKAGNRTGQSRTTQQQQWDGDRERGSGYGRQPHHQQRGGDTYGRSSGYEGQSYRQQGGGDAHGRNSSGYGGQSYRQQGGGDEYGRKSSGYGGQSNHQQGGGDAHGRNSSGYEGQSYRQQGGGDAHGRKSSGYGGQSSPRDGQPYRQQGGDTRQNGQSYRPHQSNGTAGQRNETGKVPLFHQRKKMQENKNALRNENFYQRGPHEGERKREETDWGAAAAAAPAHALPQVTTLSLSETAEEVVAPSVANALSLSQTAEEVVAPSVANTLSLSETAEEVVAPSVANTLSLSETAEEVVAPSVANTLSLTETAEEVVAPSVANTLSLSQTAEEVPAVTVPPESHTLDVKQFETVFQKFKPKCNGLITFPAKKLSLGTSVQGTIILDFVVDEFSLIDNINPEDDTPIQAEKGDMVLAKDVLLNKWSRAVVSNKKVKYQVHLIDRAREVHVDQVLGLTDELQQVMHFGGQLTVIQELQPGFLSEMEKLVDQGQMSALFMPTGEPGPSGAWECLLFLTSHSDTDQPDAKGLLAPWTPSLLPTPEMIPLRPGDIVMVLLYINVATVFVRPVRVEQDFNRLTADISSHCFNAPPLNVLPAVGDVVAANYKKDNVFYRAYVRAINQDDVRIVFIDYGNTDTVTLQDMRALPENLRSPPAYSVRVSLKDVPNKPTDKGQIHWKEIITSCRRLELRFDGSDKKNVELIDEETGKLVNSELIKLSVPDWEINKNKDKNKGRTDGEMFVITMLPSFKLEEFHELLVTHIDAEQLTTQGIFYGCLLDFPIEEFLAPYSLMGTELQKYAEATDYKVYLPRDGELCVAEYEGMWYRAFYLNASSSVYFIDYGNTERVETSCMRMMAPDFMKLPPLSVEIHINQAERLVERIDDVKTIVKVEAKLECKVTKVRDIRLIVEADLPALHHLLSS